MFAVQGIYTDGAVTINEYVPINKNYDVIVTFIKPQEQSEKISAEIISEEINSVREKKIAALARITGVLSNCPMTLEEAKTERLSRQ